MRIVVTAKFVPDATATRRFDTRDNTTDRETEGILNELDEYAVEEALRLTHHEHDQVIVLTVGPEDATIALRKALHMGADIGVHVTDAALAGSDAVSTSHVLAAAITHISACFGPIDVVLSGMASTDGGMRVIPAMLAECLDLPMITFADELTITNGVARIHRATPDAHEIVEADLPAIISVSDRINEPRYPTYRQIIAANSKHVYTWELGDIGIDPTTVGHHGARTYVRSATPATSTHRRHTIVPEAQGGQALAELLRAHGTRPA
ncbi:electron transfer flavoprotein subunit beta/FixA family protein [Dermatophilus congolensis]|uniref:electron transfer flavoprotein subunit beta/FixA family protein n=1 Tax=Dermatophilus congolensis TaxID=1863 RepID=UPI001AAF8DCB|nr:electron transfer flavoprotein subunit beta/FixA family protein [Dermatophilus congolensis]MBO3132611.1 electron transfer flavoprotein subunit beta/FixA family protein [Dermatophilus congolensis]MBO3166283.1 electron transfer flavoprotein subunit beta/FixA family protein [Dermatophilus congolensis]